MLPAIHILEIFPASPSFSLKVQKIIFCSFVATLKCFQQSMLFFTARKLILVEQTCKNK